MRKTFTGTMRVFKASLDTSVSALCGQLKAGSTGDVMIYHAVDVDCGRPLALHRMSSRESITDRLKCKESSMKDADAIGRLHAALRISVEGGGGKLLKDGDYH